MYTPAAMLPVARAAVAERAHEYRGRWPVRAGADGRWLVGLMLVAALLRFITLSHQSLWLDESQAVHEVRLAFSPMLHAWSTTEWNPPLYLLIAWPWAKLFGTGEVGLRSLSALLGVAVVPLLYLSGRELVSRRAGLAAAALGAINPFMIWYSQEAREYMLLLVFCTASLWLFARAWRAPSGRALAWWALAAALALLTQYFAGFLIAAEGLLLVYRARSRASVAALAVQAIVLAPFIPHVLPHIRRPTGFIVGVALSLRLQQIPVSFGLYPVYQDSAARYGLLAAALLVVILVPLLLVGLEDAPLRGTGLAALLAAAVIGVPLLLALAGRDNVIARALMPAWPALAIVLGAACAAPQARAAGLAFALLLGALFVYGDVRVGSEPSCRSPTCAPSRARSARRRVRGRSSPTAGSSPRGRCLCTCRGSPGPARARRRCPRRRWRSASSTSSARPATPSARGAGASGCSAPARSPATRSLGCSRPRISRPPRAPSMPARRHSSVPRRCSRERPRSSSSREPPKLSSR